MAKAVITVEDTEDGMVRTCVEFEPSIKADDQPTNAQGAALAMLKWINNQPGDDLEIEEVETD